MYLPDLVLKDGVGFEVDRKGNLAQLEVVDKPGRVCLLAMVKQLQHVLTRGEDHLERLVILLLPPGELTRLVEEACERVQFFVVTKNATVDAAEYGAEAGSNCKVQTYCHLKELCNWLAVGAGYVERILGDSSSSKAKLIDAVVYLRVQGRLASKWVSKGMLVALKAQLCMLLFAIEKTEVTDGMLQDIQLFTRRGLIILANAIL